MATFYIPFHAVTFRIIIATPHLHLCLLLKSLGAMGEAFREGRI